MCSLVTIAPPPITGAIGLTLASVALLQVPPTPQPQADATQNRLKRKYPMIWSRKPNTLPASLRGVVDYCTSTNTAVVDIRAGTAS